MPRIFRSHAHRLLWSGALAAVLAAGSGSALAQQAAAKHPAKAAAVVTPFNILPIRPEAFAGFLPVMQANAAASRKEDGNHAFDVFQPEDGTTTLYLLELWANQPAFDKHLTQPNLKAVQEHGKTDFAEGTHDLRLTAVPGLGPQGRKPFPSADAAATSRNVIVLFKVKPTQEKTFVKALTEVTPHALRAPGNRAFELYRIQSQPHAYVLFERWDSVAAHEAHLGQDYSKRLDAIVPGTLAEPVTAANRFLVKDVAAR